MSGSDSDLSDLGPEYGDEDEMMQASSEEEELDEDRGMMSDGDNEIDDYDDDVTSVDEAGFDAVDVGSGKGKGASYQVDYTALSKHDLAKEMKKEIDHVAGALSLNDKEAAALLRHLKWNKEKRYFENPEKLRQDAGIDFSEPTATGSKSQPRLKRIKGFQCEICCDDSEASMETIALGCNHRYCRECYTSYLDQKIKEEGEAKSIQCMSHNCNIVVDERTVELLVDSSVMARYRELLNQSYVDDDPSLRWCPAPNCEYAVRCPGIAPKSLDSVVPTVQCACSTKFCFGCGLDMDHQPCICPIVKLWLRKCADDSETANWISANTKECPKCQATIEKNGGCNHMTCKKCKYEFCWICMGEWSAHGTSWYNCNRFDEKKEGKDANSKSRASLERYLHYYNRYANHEQSAKLEKETYARIERRMEEIQSQSALSWIEVQFLKKAVDVLGECRATLKWTYAMAFYLVKGNHTSIFEANQSDLELAVENLSELLEAPIDAETIPELKAKTTDKSVYVQKRHDIMLRDTLEGLAEDRWQWSITVR
ncbi:MAG: hypothetical protein CYPHOPRED_002569 [Cyphobasidiales sp. Tagirdzhanova-0007]|nr:MAG: hypothetical protein CYPHOPRED_002569 [Cyphobasidiales sp. Tagirdzhanova-0007]